MSKPKLKTQNFFSRVYEVVEKIPKGKVVAYGEIARALGTRDARKVGWALHVNKDPGVPCHRVVNKEGKLAKNFGLGGWEEQKRKLEEEDVEVVGRRVEMVKYLFRLDL